MTDKKPNAAGYIRVSSAGQTDNESLSTQRSKIKKHCKAHEYTLTEIYADEGISGGSVKERKALLQALHDGQKNKFDILIVNDLSRFGRNARELLNNHEELEQYGIKLRSIKEGIHFDTPIGKAMLTMLAAIAELEMTMIKERMLENRIAKALQGIPTSGNLPFGRTYDKETKKWGIDPDKKQAIQWIADQYLKNVSLRDLIEQVKPRFGFSITYAFLTTVLKQSCGDKWEVNFEELGEPITYEIPRLLSDSKIQAVKDRLAYNRTNNRTDTKDYLLTGFLRCMHCEKSLIGQTQNNKYKYEYYVHHRTKIETCREFSTLALKKVEENVFEMIFEDIGDMASFEQAISQSLPDTDYIQKLDSDIEQIEKTISQSQKKLDKLIDLALEETLGKDTIRERERNLIHTKQKAVEELDQLQQQRKALPDILKVKEQAYQIRKDLLKKYESIERLHEMTFAEKRQLLHFLFDGKDPNGREYGIYVDKKGIGKNAEIYYHLYGRLRALKHKDPDGGKGGRTRLFEVGNKGAENGKSSDYKTNNVALNQQNNENQIEDNNER